MTNDEMMSRISALEAEVGPLRERAINDHHRRCLIARLLDGAAQLRNLTAVEREIGGLVR